MWVWVGRERYRVSYSYSSYSLFMFNRRMRFDVSPARRYDINIASDTLKPSLLSLRRSCYKWAGGPCLRAAARGCTRSTAPRSRRTGRPTSPSSWTWAQTCRRCMYDKASRTPPVVPKRPRRQTWLAGLPVAPPLLVAGDVVGGAAAVPPKLVLLMARRRSWWLADVAGDVPICLTLGAGTLRYWKKAAVSA